MVLVPYSSKPFSCPYNWCHSIIFQTDEATVKAAKTSWDIPDFPRLGSIMLQFTSGENFGDGESDWEW